MNETLWLIAGLVAIAIIVWYVAAAPPDPPPAPHSTTIWTP
jgi:hypothetical protein